MAGRNEQFQSNLVQAQNKMKQAQRMMATSNLGGTGGSFTNAYVNPLDDVMTENAMMMQNLLNSHDRDTLHAAYQHDYDMNNLADKYMQDMSTIA